jgi:hypothetical protein
MATEERLLRDIGPFAFSHMGKMHETVVGESWNSPMNGRDFKAWHIRDCLCAVLGPLPDNHPLYAGRSSYSELCMPGALTWDMLNRGEVIPYPDGNYRSRETTEKFFREGKISESEYSRLMAMAEKVA